MKGEISITLERDDLDTLHDVIMELPDVIIELWDILPYDIKFDALQWGVSDTPTRENMYVHWKGVMDVVNRIMGYDVRNQNG